MMIPVQWVIQLVSAATVALPSEMLVQSISSTNAVRSSLVANETSVQAGVEILSCTGRGDVPLPAACGGEWNGIKWRLATKTWTAQLDLPNGTRWIGRCRHDTIDQQDRCNWRTGDEFLIGLNDGGEVVVHWGLRRFPRSRMEARFDEAPPITTVADEWSSSEAGKIYRQMLTGKVLHYRWYSWPEESERGGSINLTGFADAAALMKSLGDDFTVKRVLNKIPVDQ